MDNSRDRLVLLKEAKLYTETIKFILEVSSQRVLSGMEIFFLDNSAKEVIFSLRSSLQTISEMKVDAEWKRETHEMYKRTIKSEFKFHCLLIIMMLKRNTFKFSPKGHLLIAYQKMIGDYNRYLAELSDEFLTATNKAKEAYEMAMQTSRLILSPCHPTRLGVFLNCSFLYESLGRPNISHEIATQAYNLGLMESMLLMPDVYMPLSRQCLHLLAENIKIFDEKKSKTVDIKWETIFMIWLAYVIMKWF